MNFAQRLNEQIRLKGTPCIVGLDPEISLFAEEVPEKDAPERFLEINVEVIDAVSDLVAAVKPQSAYYERYGSRGIAVLEETVRYARSKGLMTIMDVKRGDIASTADAYAGAYIGPRDAPLASDSMTVSPYLGPDTLEPFAKACREFGTGMFVLAVTSNPGSPRLQKLEAGGKPVYEHVADMVRELAFDGDSEYTPFGVVAGATYPAQAEQLRAKLPRSIFLVPGFGAQGGDPAVLKAFFNPDGLGAVVSSSRAVMFPHRYGGEATVRDAAASFVAIVRNALTIA